MLFLWFAYVYICPTHEAIDFYWAYAKGLIKLSFLYRKSSLNLRFTNASRHFWFKKDLKNETLGSSLDIGKTELYVMKLYSKTLSDRYTYI